MTGRELVFAHPEIIRLASEEFIPVAADDWYQRRRQDAEGEFFRSVADQGPRKGNGTRQGIYCLSASGKLLAYRNHHDPEVMLQELRRGLAAFRALPESERAPGAVRVPENPEVDKQFARALPPGGLVLKSYTRAVERDAEGKWQTCSGDAAGRRGNIAAIDHLWLTEPEWKSLLAEVAAGENFPLPRPIAERLLRFHLVDNTRGEPPAWRREDIRTADLKLHVIEAGPRKVRMRLEGAVRLATSAEPSSAERGYEACLLGHLTFDKREGRFTRFDLLALGDHWGEGPYTGGARPGKAPLLVAFELADTSQPRNQIPPQFLRDPWSYWGRDR